MDTNTRGTHLDKQKTGRDAEDRACFFLESQGLTLLTKNFRCKLGEIDLIMQDQKFIVFVEVRSKNRSDYGGALISVNKLKQHKLIRIASFYLQQQKCYNKVHCRFDVIGITEKKLEWIKNAFLAN